MERIEERRTPGLGRDLVFLSWFALAKVLLHIPWLHRHGFHRDELYFMSCGNRLDFGYADHAPLVSWIAALSNSLFGVSVVGLRVLPLLAGVLLVYLTGLLTRAFGGRRFAMGVAVLCVMLAPVFLRTSNMLSIPSFEPVYWTACALILARLIQRGPGPLWLLFGLVAGLGLMNKHTMLLFGFAVVVGMLLSPERRHFATRWPWLGGLCTLVVFSPNLIWQIQHDWATLTFASRLNAEVMSRISRTEFLVGQIIYLGAASAVVWIAGLAYLAFGQSGRLRVFGWMYATVLGALLVLGSKIYYSAPIYPVLFAAGAVAWELHLHTVGRVLLVAWLTMTGVVLIPFSLPVLPIEEVDEYAQAATLGLLENSHEVTGDLHDMLGWRAHAEAVAEVYSRLSPADREGCLLWGGNYGEAGCLEHFWPLVMPPPVAGNHLSWHFWGPPPGEWKTALALSRSRGVLDRMFEEVEMVERSPGDPNAIERGVPIFLCRRPRGDLRDLWPSRADF